MAQLLGIDVGTSACKVAVFNEDGTLLAQANVSYPVHYPHPGWAEQDPEEWWAAIVWGVHEVLKAPRVLPSEICGIGVDGQSWSAIPIDEHHHALARSPIWMDSRSKKICQRVRKELGDAAIFNLAGNAFMPGYTTPKMLWFKEERPQIFARTRFFLQSNAYMVLKLTDRVSQDLSQGYGLHFFDIAHLRYDEAMAKALGLSTDLVPPLVSSNKVVGGVTQEAAELTGLEAGTPVVAGGLDSACGALGAGVFEDGQAQEQGGTAGGLSYCASHPLAHSSLILSPHVVEDHWLLQGGTVGGGGVLRWFKDELGNGASFDELTALAKNVAPGAGGLIFLPYMAGERSPIWNANARGVLFGLTFATTKGMIIRALLESVAFALEHNLLTAQEAGAHIQELYTMGGMANSVLWTQIKADVTGKTMLVCASDTACCAGAAMLAGVGVGLYKTYEEAVGRFVAIRRVQECDALAHKAYKPLMERYLALSSQLQPTFCSFAANSKEG